MGPTPDEVRANREANRCIVRYADVEITFAVVNGKVEDIGISREGSSAKPRLSRAQFAQAVAIAKDRLLSETGATP